MKYYVEYTTYVNGIVDVPDDIDEEKIYDYLSHEIDYHNLYCDTDPKIGGGEETLIKLVKKVTE